MPLLPRFRTTRAWVASGAVALAAVAAWPMLPFAGIVPVVRASEPIGTAPADADGWRRAAVADVDALRDELAANTPIPFDTENPAYRRWLEEGHAEARARAASVVDAAGHYYAVAAYANGFRDPHVAVDPAVPLPPARWPGFVVEARGGRALVAARDDDPASPPVGAEILACDGDALDRLLADRVFPFVLNPALALDRRRAITRLFLDRANPFAPAPARCVLRDAEGERPLELRWRPLPEPPARYWSAYGAATAGAGAPWGVEQPAPAVYWVGIPTFELGDESAPRLRALVDDLRRRRDEMRAARAIVVDVRGNGGGNTQWADRIATLLLGPDDRESRGTVLPPADWRGSPGNAAFFRRWADERRRELAPDELRLTLALADALEAAADRDPPLLRLGDREAGPVGGHTRRRPAPVAGAPASRVYLLSNGTCASTCLLFADRLLHEPGARLIGAATGGDGPYGEVREVVLPSGRIRATIPQKVFRQMPRAPFEAYEPDVAYEGPWDDAAVRRWVMATVGAVPDRHAGAARDDAPAPIAPPITPPDPAPRARRARGARGCSPRCSA